MKITPAILVTGLISSSMMFCSSGLAQQPHLRNPESPSKRQVSNGRSEIERASSTPRSEQHRGTTGGASQKSDSDSRNASSGNRHNASASREDAGPTTVEKDVKAEPLRRTD